MAKNVAVITKYESDLLRVLQKTEVDLKVIKPGEIEKNDLNECDCFIIIGGVEKNPLLLEPRERILIDEQLYQGKKIFSEYCGSIGTVYFEQPQRTRFEQLVYCDQTTEISDWEKGDLLDDQYGLRIRPHDISCVHDTPILQYTKRHAHDSLEWSEDLLSDVSDRALWFDHPKNLLISSFQLCHFKKNRFSPKGRIHELIHFILNWLLDGSVEIPRLTDEYKLGPDNVNEDVEHLLGNAITHAMSWFSDAEILLNEGKDGVLEGLGTEIGDAGTQRVSTAIRTDCIGEASQAYLFHYLLTGNKKSLEVSDNLTNFIFDNMQIKNNGPLHGMVRWTNEAWEVCYQDDVARAIIPELLKALYTDETKHLQSCVDALKFLVKTTGTDGTRVPRTDNINLNERELERLKSQPGNYPSAHYNAYYHAALLLAYKLTRIDEFKEVAVKGLETIMGEYPETLREHSQTQELCRLVLPLSWLYWVTSEQKHLEWLYMACHDLEWFEHKNGGYIEWDDGYKATMRNPVGEGESSLLTKNGDPVVDMLYSNNWLPMGFLQAYFVTDDEYFMHLWDGIAKYMIQTQIFSDNKQINGGWARSIDVDRMEVYGSPADVGWGPWAMESGWMQAQIVSGLMGGMMYEQLKPYYRK